MTNRINFFLLDLDYIILDGKPIITIFGSTKESRKIVISDTRFKPYFYAISNDPESLIQKIRNTETEKKEIKAIVTDTEIVEKNHMGQRVKAIKIFTNIPAAVPLIAKEIQSIKGIKSVHEFDISFTKRYLIDQGLTPLKSYEAEINESENIVELISIKETEEDFIDHQKIMAFDIETYYKSGKLNPEHNPVIMLSIFGKDYRKVLTYKTFKTEHDYIEFVESEADLIRRFAEIIKKESPDIITGYNSDGFDFPYLRVRAKKYKVKLDLGIDKTEVKFSRGNYPSAGINGIIHIDIFQFIKRMMAQSLQTDSYKLDNVAEEILGEKKIDVEITGLADAWDKCQGLELYSEYNLKDSELTYRLCKEFMPNIIEFTKLVSISAFDVIRVGFSQIVESYLLLQAPKYNLISPNKPSYESIKERRNATYQGAFVYEPTPGLYNDIVVLDFRSLYPTIMSSHNIGPETINCECCKDNVELAPTKSGKYWFCKKIKGFIPSVIEDVITRRIRIKEIIKTDKPKDGSLKLLDARQYSLKVMANSFYGYLGFFGSRWYSVECARSITAYARYYILKLIKDAEEQGFKIIYSDTDSIFMLLEGKELDHALKFVEKTNRDLPGIMELEYEGRFPSGIFVSAKLSQHGAKKKYALLTEKGDMKITGFETVRSNWSNIAKDVQENVLQIILKENNKEKALNYVQTVIKRINDHKVSIENIELHTQLTKNIEDYESIGPHVAIAKRMVEKGLNVVPGDIIRYVICEGKGIVRERAKMPSECKQEEYDTEYYVNNQIIPAVDKIFEVLGYSKEQILGNTDQKDLNSFFR